MEDTCLACGEKYTNFDKILYKCPNCGLGKTIIPTSLDKGTYHRDNVYLSEKKQFENIFQKIVGKISKIKNKGNVLEIGSSTGLLLSLFPGSKWTVQGIEPSKQAFKISQGQGIPTINTTFKNAKLKENFFDVIVLNHVLEHLENPKITLNKIYKVLKKDGILYLSVPNFNSLSAKIYKSNWGYILPKEHTWHFTPQSLSLLLQKNRLEIKEWSAVSGV